MTHETIPFQLTVHTLWGPVVFEQERYACMPGSDSAIIVGRVALDKLGLTVNNQMFKLARARRAGQLVDVENSGYS